MTRKLSLSQVPYFALKIRHSKFGISILTDYLVSTQNDHHQHALALATGILAFRGYPPPYPREHPTHKLAMSLLEQLHKQNLILKISHDEHKKHKSYQPSISVSQDYDIVPPADWVHHERRLENERQGKTYHPPKAVGMKKARRGVKDTIVSIGQARLHFR